MKTGIWEYNELEACSRMLQEKTTVLVGGCFDLLHYGHYSFLKKAAAEGNFLIVALEPDVYIQKHKQREPIHNQQQRAELLSSTAEVDAVVLLPYFSSDTEYQQLVETIKPDVIATTEGDPHEDKKRKQAEGIGSRLAVVSPLLEEYSTTKILERLE